MNFVFVLLFLLVFCVCFIGDLFVSFNYLFEMNVSLV